MQISYINTTLGLPELLKIFNMEVCARCGSLLFQLHFSLYAIYCRIMKDRSRDKFHFFFNSIDFTKCMTYFPLSSR
jgi:hypothetical protein